MSKKKITIEHLAGMVQRGVPSFGEEVLLMITRDFVSVMSNKLGSLEKYNGSKGESTIHVNNFLRTITVEYVVSADFVRGPAEITIGLIRKHSSIDLDAYVETGSRSISKSRLLAAFEFVPVAVRRLNAQPGECS